MFDKGRRRQSPRRQQYDGIPDQGAGIPFGQSPAAGPVRRSTPGGPDVDEYMYRSIMGMAGGAPAGTRTAAGQQQARAEQDEAAPDSVILRIELPTARAEQLRTLARDLDESPQTLARLWVMERLRDLAAGRATGTRSQGTPQAATPPQVIGLPSPAPVPALTVADLKKQLGDSLITDPEERAVYDETYSFRQWGPYIASLVLSSRGRRVITLEDKRVLLRDELMVTLYDTPGALDSDLVVRDAELGRPGDQLRPFACLQRVSPGVYSYLGFNRARAMRSAR
jgi:hypothetical protein